jgi:hypothetical protein
MLKFVLRNLSLFVVLCVSFSASFAQDYRANRQAPREMVYQPAPQRQPNFFERLFGGSQRETYVPPPEYYAPQNAVRPLARASREDNYSSRPSVPKAATQGVKAYCVRSCDGFFFPIAIASGEAKDSITTGEICQSLCPGATTELYKMTNGSIETMVSPARKAYSAHPKAFAFREKLENSCSCKGTTTGGLARIPHTRDYTLREGDLILLDEGLYVFEGGDNYPYKKTDFAAAGSGGRLSKDMRAMLTARNIPLTIKTPTQLAANRPNRLADSFASDLEANSKTSQNIRLIDILAKEKTRPKLMIDIIQSRRYEKL